MRQVRRLRGAALRRVGFSTAVACLVSLFAAGNALAASVRLAVIGDYGFAGAAEQAVADMVAGWGPDLVVTTGDNNYYVGSAATIDDNIGQYFHSFIFPYVGGYGAGATVNRFFPILGNHDWGSITCVGGNCSGPYFDYFALPGNERYYDQVWGPVHLFVLDSDPHEPDGISSTSAQAAWLQAGLAASTAPWKLVCVHHPPFSSGAVHGSNPALQWPYQSWGASAVLSGHEHTYERLMRSGLPYFVNGLGGLGIYSFNAPEVGSVARYNGDYGAMRVDAADDQVTFSFFSVAQAGGVLIDSYTRYETLCGPAPQTQCRLPAKSRFVIKNSANDNKDTLRWTWHEASPGATQQADLGGPETATRYAVCVYDRDGASVTLVLAADALAGGACGKQPCWRALRSSGFRYRDSTTAPDGLLRLQVRTDRNQRLRITARGKGANLRLPVLPLAQNSTVTVQLINSDGACWGAEFAAPARDNATDRFLDRTD